MLTTLGRGFSSSTSDKPGKVFYKPEFSYDLVDDRVLPAGWTFTRSAAALYLDQNNRYQLAGIDTPRFPFDYDRQEWGGLLLEPLVTNKVHYNRPVSGSLSDHFESVPAELSVSTSSSNPYNALTNGSQVWYLDLVSSGVPKSVTFKATLGNTNAHSIEIWVQLVSGSGATVTAPSGAQKTVTATGTWQRVVFEDDTPSSSTESVTVEVNLGSTAMFTGINIQEAMSLTSPIETSGVPVARPAEYLVLPEGSWLNPDNGTVIIEYDKPTKENDGYQTLFYLGDTSSYQRLNVVIHPYGRRLMRCVRGGYTWYETISNETYGPGMTREGLSYTSDRLSFAVNGASPGSSVGADRLPTNFEEGLCIGHTPDDTSSHMHMYVRKLAYYRQSMTVEALKRNTSYPNPYDIVRDEALDMVVVAGQWNAVGRAPSASAPTYANLANMKLVGNDDVLKSYVDPYDDDANQRDTISADSNADLGFAGAMLDQLITETGNTAAVVPSTKGGADITEWAQDDIYDTTLYISLLRRCQLADYYGVLKCIVWCHGESDANSSISGETYTAHLTLLFERLRQDLNKPDLPIVIVSLHDKPSSGSFPTWDDIRTAQANFNIGNVTIVPSVGYSTNPSDETNFDASGYTALGTAIGTAVAGVI